MTPPPPPSLQSQESSWPPPYPYRGLTGSQIRVIRIVLGNDSQINCSPQHVASDEAPHYHALSYVWGNPNVKRLINLDGHDFFATSNLYSALRKLQSIPPRDGHSFNLFWIDAICVNQADAEEESVQVPRMGTIYKEADLVFIWLSIVSKSEGCNVHTATLRKAVRPKEANLAAQKVFTVYRAQKVMGYLPSRVPNGEETLGSQRLVNEAQDKSKSQNSIFSLGPINSMFRRTWTLQEAVLATKSRVFLFTGTSSRPGEYDAITLDYLASFEDGNGEFLNGLTSMRSWVKDPTKAVEFVGGNAGWMLLRVLEFVQLKDATVFHDHLYGIYGILETLKPHFPQLRLPKVDYGRPAARIFTELTRFIIESTRDAAVLDSALARSRVPEVCGFHNVWTPKYSPPLDGPSDKPVVSADGLRLSVAGYIAAALWIVVPGFVKRGSRDMPTLDDGFQQIEDQIVEPVANRFNPERRAVRRRVCRGNGTLLKYYEDLRLDVSGCGPKSPSLLMITFGSVKFVTDRGDIGISHTDRTPEVGDYLCHRKGADQPIILHQASSGTYQVIGPPAWFVENSFHSRCQGWHRVTPE